MPDQVERLETLRGELREEKEVVAALEEERIDNARVHNEMRLRLEAERDQARKQVLEEVAEEFERRATQIIPERTVASEAAEAANRQAAAYCREQASLETP